MPRQRETTSNAAQLNTGHCRKASQRICLHAWNGWTHLRRLAPECTVQPERATWVQTWASAARAHWRGTAHLRSEGQVDNQEKKLNWTGLAVNFQSSSACLTQSKTHQSTERQKPRERAGGQQLEHKGENRQTIRLKARTNWLLTTCQCPLQTKNSSSALEMSVVHLLRTATFQCVWVFGFVYFFQLVVFIYNSFKDDENAPSKIKLKLNMTALLCIGLPAGQPHRPGTCLWCRYFLAPGWQAFWELTGRKARTRRRLERACKRGKPLKRRIPYEWNEMISVAWRVASCTLLQ